MKDLPAPHRLAQWAGWIAIFGAALGCIADVCLLYHPAGGYLDGDYAFMASISPSRLLWGHYLGLFAIPLEAAGLFLVYRALLPAGKRLALGAALAGIYLIYPGVAYHGTVYPLSDAVRRGSDAVNLLKPFSEPLGAIFAGAFLLLMLWMGILILRQKTTLPRWTILASPVLTYPLWTALPLVWPTVGNVLAPMGFNLSMAIFLGVLLWREGQAEPTGD